MIQLDQLKFNAQGLIPAVIQDVDSNAILMLGYMNLESLTITLSEGRTCFFSRSRQTLWRKGETSGNIQYVREIWADCDLDCLLIKVKQIGPTCHTGKPSCFFNSIAVLPAT